MRVDPNGEGWIKFVFAIVVFVVLTVNLTRSSSDIEAQKEQAADKYNEGTVSINNNIEDALVNVTVDTTGEVIQIQDSYKISNKYEQEAILTVVINSDEYKGNHKDLEKMTIEWSAHNLVYHVTKNEKMNELITSATNREDAHISSQSVDIAQSDSLYWLYYIVTCGGELEW